MSWNGSGTFSSLTAPTFPAVANTTIASAYYNAVINDLVTGVNTCVTKDGQNAMTANFNLGGFRLSNVALGLVGTPSIYFTGDTDTGIFSPGANQISLVVNGASVAAASTTGLVVTGALTATSFAGLLTSATGLPISTGVSGLGTNVATALAVNVGTAGAFTVLNGAGGTPSSLTLTNATGLPITAGTTGTLGETRGGTNQSTYSAGDLIQGTGSNTLGKLSSVATGNVLISGGVATASSWGKVGLTTHITGTLPVGNGGLGITSVPTNGQIPIGNGTNYVAAAITQGAGMTVTNGSGTITLATAVAQASGGTNSLSFGLAAAAVGSRNSSFGIQAGNALGASNTDNTLGGYQAGLLLNSTAAFNTFWGTGAGSSVTTASFCTLIGGYSGLSTGNSQVALSNGSGNRVFWSDNTDSFIAHGTTASAANAYLDAGTSKIQRSTSSERYKRDIEPMEDTYAGAILQLQPIFYRSAILTDRQDWSFDGFSAEQVAKINPRWVQWAPHPDDWTLPDHNNERFPKPDARLVPDGVTYDRLVVPLLSVVKAQAAEIVDLKTRLEVIEKKLGI